jgi:hypothetical protein
MFLHSSSSPFVNVSDVTHSYALGLQPKIQDLGYNFLSAHAPETNLAKRNYRIIPLIPARITGSLKSSILFNQLCQVGIAALLFYLFYQKTQNLKHATLLALILTSTYLGFSAQKDWCLWFDAVSYAIILASFATRSRIALGILILLGCFSDERFYTVIPLIAIYHLQNRQTKLILSVGIAVGISVLIRVLCNKHLPMPTAAVATTDILLSNLRYYYLHAFQMLKGGWFLIVPLLGYLAYQHSWWRLAISLAIIFTYSLLPLLVLDITRSGAFYGAGLFLVLLNMVNLRSVPAKYSYLLAGAVAASLLLPNVIIISGLFEHWF